jgi:phosphatidylglycerophosphate synthase
MADKKGLKALRVACARLWSHDVRRVAFSVELCTVVITGAGVAWAYGGVSTLRYLLGLLAALAAQQLFVSALRRRLGPERSTLADAITLGRASVGAMLAGLVVAGIQDRGGVVGWVAWCAVLVGASSLDWCDGPLARRLGATRLGGAIDIEADSWLTLWSAAGAVVWGGLPWWCLLAPLAHYGRPIIALRRGEMPSGGDPWWGHITGGAQMVLIMCALAPVYGDLRDALLGWAALPVSVAQLLVMFALVYGRARTVEKAALPYIAR